jgi:hypothetical protein
MFKADSVIFLFSSGQKPVRMGTHRPHPDSLTGVGFLQSGGVVGKKIVNGSRREVAPTMEMNGNIVE